MSNASAESLEVDGFVFHHPGSKWDEFKIVGTDQFVFFKYKPTEGYVGQINVWYPKNDRVTFRDLKVFFQQDLKKDKRFKNIEGHIWDEPYGEMECYRYNESYENHDKSRKGIISIAKKWLHLRSHA